MKNSRESSVAKTNLRLGLLDRLLRDKRYKEALAEIRDIEATQKPDRSSIEFGHFCYYCAEVLRKLGDYETALERAREAFEVFRETGENRRIAEIKYVMGSTHIVLGNLKTAQEHLQDSLGTYKRIDDERGKISALCMLANVSFRQAQYELAIECLSEAIGLCDKIGENGIKARGFGNLGRIYLRIGKWKQAEENLLLSLESNRLSNDLVNVCCCYLSLGYVSFLLRRFRDSESYNQGALKLVLENNYTREMAIYHEYSGELAFARRDYTLAKEHYEKAIEIGEKIAPEGDIISQTCRLLAEVQIAEKEYDQALSSCDRAMKVATSLGERIEIGAIHRALGQIHTAKGKRQKAKENFDKSISILQQIGAKYELGKAYLEAVKSNAYEYVDRVAHFARGREVFKELESDYHVAMITLAFCEFLCERGEQEKAEVHLADAERILKRLKEKKDLDSILELRSRIDRALGRIGAPGTKHRTEYRFSDVVTRDPGMLGLIEQARRFKDADVPILLEGETGTGKDLLAKVIHCESKRKDKRFVKVNCAAIPDSLLESELFGYRRGAFSGAGQERIMEETDRGTTQASGQGAGRDKGRCLRVASSLGGEERSRIAQSVGWVRFRLKDPQPVGTPRSLDTLCMYGLSALGRRCRMVTKVARSVVVTLALLLIAGCAGDTDMVSEPDQVDQLQAFLAHYKELGVSDSLCGQLEETLTELTQLSSKEDSVRYGQLFRECVYLNRQIALEYRLRELTALADTGTGERKEDAKRKLEELLDKEGSRDRETE
jgi:tetratricopeptide (TPR) repeat protein